MAHSPSWTTLAAAAALASCALLVALRRVRSGTHLRTVLVHALGLGLVLPVLALGVVFTCHIQDVSWHETPGRLGLVALGLVVSALCAVIALYDAAWLVHAHRMARRARTARAPSGPVGVEGVGFDFGIGDEVAVIEQAPEAPYREAARVEHAFRGSARRALGAMRRAWALEVLAVVAITGATAIASRAKPQGEPVLVQDPPKPIPPEPTLESVWSTSFSGDARFVGVQRGRVVVALSDAHPASWSLRTIDPASGDEQRWDASAATAGLWTGLHTSDGFHPVDHDLDHDLLRYAALVASTGRRDLRVAVSRDAIVWAKHDSEDEPTRLWMLERDSMRRSLLDKTHAGSSNAAFSRDGKRLAWVAWTDRVASEGYSIVEARADGTGQREVRKAGSFGWRADGHLVAHTMNHQRECIVDADEPTSLHHCIQDAHLGTLAWDERGESAAWVGFVGGSLAYEWIRLTTGEVLAHGALVDAHAYGDVVLDAGERPALFVLAGRSSPTAFVLERVDLRSGQVTDVLSHYFETGASGLGTMVEAEDGSLFLTERELRPEPRVRIVRVYPAALRGGASHE